MSWCKRGGAIAYPLAFHVKVRTSDFIIFIPQRAQPRILVPPTPIQTFRSINSFQFILFFLVKARIICCKCQGEITLCIVYIDFLTQNLVILAVLYVRCPDVEELVKSSFSFCRFVNSTCIEYIIR